MKEAVFFPVWISSSYILAYVISTEENTRACLRQYKYVTGDFNFKLQLDN